MTIENEFTLDIAFHPGETLIEKLEELKMGPKEFAVRTGKPEKTILAVIKGESSITSDMAILFEDVTQIPARMWLKLQFEFDEYVSRQKREADVALAKDWASKFPYTQMANLKWVPPAKGIEQKVLNLFKYFGLSSQEAWEEYFYNQQLKVAFRISIHNTKNPHALSAWIRRGEIESNGLEVTKYNKQALIDKLSEIKSIMAEHHIDYFDQLKTVCSSVGLKVLYTPCIKQAPISGMSRWINEHPIIQMTGRYDQNDRFWFTFFHELGHVLLHGKKDIFLEDIEYSDYDKLKEKEADDFAIKWTFSQTQESELMKIGKITERDILKYAEKFGTHPAMIVGRLQNKGYIKYSEFRQFFRKLDLT